MTVDLTPIIVPVLLLALGAAITFMVNRWMRSAMRERDARERKMDMMCEKFEAVIDALKEALGEDFTRSYDTKMRHRISLLKTEKGWNGHE